MLYAIILIIGIFLFLLIVPFVLAITQEKIYDLLDKYTNLFERK